jgi:hypothetical protein
MAVIAESEYADTASLSSSSLSSKYRFLSWAETKTKKATLACVAGPASKAERISGYSILCLVFLSNHIHQSTNHNVLHASLIAANSHYTKYFLMVIDSSKHAINRQYRGKIFNSDYKLFST